MGLGNEVVHAEREIEAGLKNKGGVGKLKGNKRRGKVAYCEYKDELNKYNKNMTTGLQMLKSVESIQISIRSRRMRNIRMRRKKSRNKDDEGYRKNNGEEKSIGRFKMKESIRN